LVRFVLGAASMNAAARRHAPTSLWRDRRGATLVEYLTLVGMIAVVGAAGVRVLGEDLSAKATAHAECVARLDCAEGSANGAAVPSGADAPAVATRSERREAPPTSGDEPSLDGFDATYETAEGEVFIDGTEGQTADEAAADPNDVSQGAIADCYLIASFAALAYADPSVIERAIRDNGDGTYTVTFYENGTPVEIVVTADFPMRDGQPVFAGYGDQTGAGEAELWIMILEKAWAQYKGSWAAIEGGWAGDPLAAITGQPSDYLPSGTFELEDVQTYLDEGWAVTAGTLDPEAVEAAIAADPTGTIAQLYGDGTVVAWHAYYVTAVDPVAGTITVRNPWGWEHGETTLTFAEFEAVFSGLTVNPIEERSP
jgi:Flp pilus assembly pilin Flp